MAVILVGVFILKMALRDQPYFPLYVQDFMTDEKLLECSPASVGVFVMIMCVMHKSKEYGTIMLKQKDKQTSKQINNFATKLVKHLPYTISQIESALNELVQEDVLQVSDDILSQKRMIKDNEISLLRSKAGKKGGKKTQFDKAKHKANSENEYESEGESNKRKVKKFIAPTENQVVEYFQENGYDIVLAKKAFKHYDLANWHDTNGKPVKNWKQKVNTNWMNKESKLKPGQIDFSKVDYDK